jgi:hypothetical protein
MKRDKEKRIVTRLHKKCHVVMELEFCGQPRKGQKRPLSSYVQRCICFLQFLSCSLINSLAIGFSHSLLLFSFPPLFVFRDEIHIFAFLYHTVLSIF